MIITPMPIFIPMYSSGECDGDIPMRVIILFIICILFIILLTIDGLTGFKISQSLGLFI